MDPRLLSVSRSGNLYDFRNLSDFEPDILLRRTTQANTALHIAARFGHASLVREMIKRKPSLVLSTNLKGETPVHIASRAGHEKIVNSFIDSVKDFSNIYIARIRDIYGNTPLHGSVKNKHSEVVLALSRQDVQSLELVNDAGESPLSIAIDLRYVGIANDIIDLNSRTLLFKSLNGQTALHVAVLRRDIGTMRKVLQKYPSSVHQHDEKLRTPLHYAAALNDHNMVKAIIRKDTWTAYTRDENRQIPLHLAAENGQENLLKALVDPCPDSIEILDKDQRNILHLAAKSGNFDAVSYILNELPVTEVEDLVNSPDVDGNTPLHLAAANIHSDVVRLLLRNSMVEIRALNNDNRSALAVLILTADQGMELQKHLTLKALKSSYKKRAFIPEEVIDPNAEFNYVNDKRSIEMAQTISVMATLIATFTFTASFTLPGGFKSVGPDEGVALLIGEAAFQAFVITDAIAMTSSITAAIIVFWSSSRRDNDSFMDTLPYAIGLTWISLIAMSLAFVTGLFVILRQVLWLAILVCVIGCAAPFSLYIFAPTFLLVFERVSSSRASISHRRNIFEDNPFLFIIRLIKMLF
ncbi:hypothetical protein REPUB_Repub05bG0041500 [Reevesia pubescens]